MSPELSECPDTAPARQVIADDGHRMDTLVLFQRRSHGPCLFRCAHFPVIPSGVVLSFFCLRFSFNVCLPFFWPSRLPLSFFPLSPILAPSRLWVPRKAVMISPSDQSEAGSVIFFQLPGLSFSSVSSVRSSFVRICRAPRRSLFENPAP